MRLRHLRLCPLAAMLIGTHFVLTARLRAQPEVAPVSAIDARLLGQWQATIANQYGEWTLTFETQPSGAYRTRAAGPVVVPDETGRLTADHGRWHMDKDNGETDSGGYRFADANTVTFTGKGPTITWRRVGAAASTLPPSTRRRSSTPRHRCTACRSLPRIWSTPLGCGRHSARSRSPTTSRRAIRLPWRD